MGKMNLLKANYEGKVGQTVGAKWKSESTLRTYTKPSNPNTEAQQQVRGNFKVLTSFVALFADAIRYKSALDTASQSVRNAIISINKEMLKTASSDDIALENVVVSKGGLQKPNTVVMTNAGSPKFTWGAITATNFTSDAKAVAVFVDPTDQIVDVVEVSANAGEAESAITFGTDSDVYGYLYFLDKRGSNKVASLSVGKKVVGA